MLCSHFSDLKHLVKLKKFSTSRCFDYVTIIGLVFCILSLSSFELHLVYFCLIHVFDLSSKRPFNFVKFIFLQDTGCVQFEVLSSGNVEI